MVIILNKNKKIYKTNKNLVKVINRRLYIINIFTIIIFIIIIYNLFNLTIINNDYYVKNLKYLTSNEIYGNSAPRGRIYDRNHKLIVDNKEIKVI